MSARRRSPSARSAADRGWRTGARRRARAARPVAGTVIVLGALLVAGAVLPVPATGAPAALAELAAVSSTTVRPVPTTLTSPPLRPERAGEAQTTRLSLAGVAHVTSVRAEALVVAGAAATAAEAALGAPDAIPADLRVRLEAGHQALLALVRRVSPTSVSGAPAGSTGAARAADGGPVLDVLVVAADLRERSDELFALALLSDDPTGAGIAATDAELTSGLPALGRLLADAERRATDLPAPLVAFATGSGAGLGSASASRTGWPNGSVPLSELCVPSQAPTGLLDCVAAAAFDRMAAAYRADTGSALRLESAYRSFDEQVAVRAARGALAAAPGRSMHGVGLAVDLADAGALGEYTAPVYLWMVEHAAAYGWYHPVEMGPGGSGPAEPWHWEFGG
ncbi:MAG TPA: M15 family metallopeptidase [Actinotalea sp.]|nr:M15 family metallopeptidase [Actinotalea sp.]